MPRRHLIALLGLATVGVPTVAFAQLGLRPGTPSSVTETRTGGAPSGAPATVTKRVITGPKGTACDQNANKAEQGFFPTAHEPNGQKTNCFWGQEKDSYLKYGRIKGE